VTQCTRYTTRDARRLPLAHSPCWPSAVRRVLHLSACACASVSWCAHTSPDEPRAGPAETVDEVTGHLHTLR
jgi:hypothetical protein